MPTSTPPASAAPPVDGLVVGGAQYPSGPPQEWPAWAWAPFPGSGGSPAPPAPGGGTGDRRAAGIVAAVATVAVLLVVGVVALASRGDDGSDVAAVDSPTSTTTSSTGVASTAPGPPTTAAGPAPEQADPPTPELPQIPELPGIPGADPDALARPLGEVLPEIVEFVETTRGHRFESVPEVEALPDAEFEARLRDAQEADEIESLRTEQVADQALGLIPPGTDLVELAGEASAAGVLGFYIPESGDLLVRGDVITPYVQTVIAHELTHALDDQTFDLGRVDGLVTQPDESAFGFISLIEGTARWVETAYRDQLSTEEQAAVETEELLLGIEQAPSLADIPLPFIIEQQIPYGAGERLVAALLADGGLPALDAGFQTPPTTSEQVLDPAVFATAEPSVAVPVPAADGDVVDQGAFGAVDVRLLEVAADPLGALDATTGAVDPVDGFGGGSYVTWRDGARACIRVAMVGDDAAGSPAIDDALAVWSQALPGAELTTGAGPGGREQTTILRCA